MFNDLTFHKIRMKIGIVCYPTFGGSGVVATELGMALARRGHQIHFITYRRPARLIHYQENVYYHEVSSFDYPLFEYKPYETALASKMVDVADHENLDLLHVHYAVPHATVGYLAKKILADRGKRVPLITTLHGTDITLVGMDPSFSPVVEFGINHSDAVTAVSHSLKNQTEEIFKVVRPIQVIYNFINFDRFSRKSSTCRRSFAQENEKVIVHVSNFRKVKRVEDVIQTFYRIQQIIPAHLVLVGDGPERYNMEELCRSLKISSRVSCLGNQDAVEEILATADLFLIPSANESFGLAALEALACQVPVISSNVGGLPEVNTHGVTGYLADLGDVDTMARYAIELLSDENKLTAFRKNALMQARRFDLQNIIPEYEKLYQDVLLQVAVA